MGAGHAQACALLHANSGGTTGESQPELRTGWQAQTDKGAIMEREEYTNEEVIAVIDWLLESYTFAELAQESGLSESTLRRMQRYGKATEQTWNRLSRIMDELTFGEDHEWLPYEEWGM